jgi:hypothetical protein
MNRTTINQTTMTQPTTTEAIVTGEDLIRQFECGETRPESFHHADHVRLAFEYLRGCAREGNSLSRDHYVELPVLNS